MKIPTTLVEAPDTTEGVCFEFEIRCNTARKAQQLRKQLGDHHSPSCDVVTEITGYTLLIGVVICGESSALNRFKTFLSRQERQDDVQGCAIRRASPARLERFELVELKEDAFEEAEPSVAA